MLMSAPGLKCVVPSWESELEGCSFVTSRALADAKLRKCCLQLRSEVLICCCWSLCGRTEQSMQKGREIVSGVQHPAAHGPRGKEYQAALCFA